MIIKINSNHSYLAMVFWIILSNFCCCKFIFLSTFFICKLHIHLLFKIMNSKESFVQFKEALAKKHLLCFRCD